MEWITENIATIIAIGTAIVTAASAIVNLTPTETDNKIVAWLIKVLDFLALNFKK